MKKTVVIDVVALSSRLIGEHTPFLNNWTSKSHQASIKPVLPAVTTSAQTTYLTGKWPTDHGIVGNGWYFKDECEIKFWRQSNKLIQAENIWDLAKKKNPEFTVSNMFWWYNMYSTADYQVTPRPLYPSDGRKIPDCHSHPMDLRDKLQDELGQFPLFSFWGPNANIASTKWIAEASKKVDEWKNPTLTLIYLPHLDYGLQKYGIDFSKISKDLNEIDAVCEDLITYYENQGAEVILLSEYGITSVSNPVHLNRVFRKAGLIQVKNELGLETLDAGTSRAFAVVDHQLAHIHVKDKEDMPLVKKLLEETPGIDLILDEDGKKEYHLDHERSGDFVVVADKDSWFTYYFWLDDAKAPDYARCVAIHQKPGYDPVELFVNPEFKFPMAKVGMKVLKKKLGFRYLMDVIPLEASLVKGAHGRIPEDALDHPVFFSKNKSLTESKTLSPVDIQNLILNQVFAE
ncbi:alkaline phosphatase family protein [Algoriphagus machipongonensis]|uniref:Type I phosphodiesterase/nucleotide pyrophosphatase family protein n=1 Tax=Algoriphagus machipongonensis TaxID=388413 RepID=A3HYX8_9BACT|nr:nucleotide pyrophosphatase/phosphodiesterase family protein [Algoriphagus machipongonensis]EAZ80464.1 type I phosphodiesterase/nucleotide pyrophosphatase family protein [Algoriphagus machipongonensis]